MIYRLCHNCMVVSSHLLVGYCTFPISHGEKPMEHPVGVQRGFLTRAQVELIAEWDEAKNCKQTIGI